MEKKRKEEEKRRRLEQQTKSLAAVKDELESLQVWVFKFTLKLLKLNPGKIGNT